LFHQPQRQANMGFAYQSLYAALAQAGG
jgi:hypothetical protein